MGSLADLHNLPPKILWNRCQHHSTVVLPVYVRFRSNVKYMQYMYVEPSAASSECCNTYPAVITVFLMQSMVVCIILSMLDNRRAAHGMAPIVQIKVADNKGGSRQTGEAAGQSERMAGQDNVMAGRQTRSPPATPAGC